MRNAFGNIWAGGLGGSGGWGLGSSGGWGLGGRSRAPAAPLGWGNSAPSRPQSGFVSDALSVPASNGRAVMGGASPGGGLMSLFGGGIARGPGRGAGQPTMTPVPGMPGWSQAPDGSFTGPDGYNRRGMPTDPLQLAEIQRGATTPKWVDTPSGNPEAGAIARRSTGVVGPQRTWASAAAGALKNANLPGGFNNPIRRAR